MSSAGKKLARSNVLFLLSGSIIAYPENSLSYLNIMNSANRIKFHCSLLFALVPKRYPVSEKISNLIISMKLSPTGLIPPLLFHVSTA